MSTKSPDASPLEPVKLPQEAISSFRPDGSIRLLSPQRRRLYPNATTERTASNGRGVLTPFRDGLVAGEPDLQTWGVLWLFGWRPYTGPAKTNDRGYIVGGSDPAIDMLRGATG